MDTLVPTLVLSALAAVAVAAAWLQSNARRLIAAHASNATMAGALSWLAEVALTLVQEAEQTAVLELKRALADGTVTRAEYLDALTRVKLQVVLRARELTVGRLVSSLGLSEPQAHELVSAKVEAAVLQTKPAASAPAVGPLP